MRTTTQQQRKIEAQPLTSGEITAAAIDHFTGHGIECWRNNQIPQRGRPFRGRKGVPDIIGFASQFHALPGAFFGCEVKAYGDSLSDEQKEFLHDLNKAGGIAYVAEGDKFGGIRYRIYVHIEK